MMTEKEKTTSVLAEPTAWHAFDIPSVIARLKTNPDQGLAKKESIKRFDRYGPNTLQKEIKVTWYRVLLRQFTDMLIIILLVAAAIALVIGEVTDAVTILVIVLLNGILGFVQEWKAERAMEALQRMLSPHCRVVRDGKEQEIDASMIVPGDIVVLEIGYTVPADLRLIGSLNLKADESSLTGESESVNKDVEPVSSEADLSERSSMAWMGTVITNGRGRGVVIATGMTTEFGRIAHLTQMVGEEKTPLQHKLALLGKQLGIFSISISVIVAASGYFLGKPILEMFLTGVSLAVAVVPEGLPAVVTITLALGIRTMVRRRALMRRLQAAETLGAATVVCSDKTGTLTQNEMTVQKVWHSFGEINVTGVGYDPAGHFEAGGTKIDYKNRHDLLDLLETGLICNHARLYKDEEGWHEVGEPTEAALVVAAYKAWLHPEEPSHTVSEFSFNSRHRTPYRRDDRPRQGCTGDHYKPLQQNTRRHPGARDDGQ
jgi:Ca2+-transporting ATPase